MFAGPNGAGKTTLIKTIRKEYDLGVLVNADEILAQFEVSPYLELAEEFGNLSANQSDLESFAKSYTNLSSRIKKTFHDFPLRIENGYALLDASKEITSYDVAFFADFLIKQLIDQKISFSYETVMSHPSKIEVLKRAKQSGFKSYLYYINTIDPEINITRVKNRIEKGGHDVPPLKIESRYYRSLDNLYDAVKNANRAFIIDNSNFSDNLIAEKKNSGKLQFIEESIPWWVDQYLLQKFK